MKANIYITYKEGILDPQGTTVNKALNSIGVKNINSLKIGKYIEIEFNESDEKKAHELVEEMCKKLLVNLIIEDYKIQKI